MADRKSLWAMIFKPHDGTRATIREEVASSRVAVQIAASRFEQTVNDLLERNDKLTGRNNEHRHS